MRKILLAIACIGLMATVEAQTVSHATMEQYRQLVNECTGGNAPQSRKTLDYCSARLEKWGFTFNRSGIADMYTIHMNPFFRQEGQDTVGCMVSTFNDVVFGISGIFSSTSPARAFPLVAAAAELQNSLAAERECVKFVCSVKGNVKNKFPKDVAELKEVLAEAGEDNVKWVFIKWESADHKQVATLVYDNKISGKKKPKPRDRVELTIAVSDNRDLDKAQ